MKHALLYTYTIKIGGIIEHCNLQNDQGFFRDLYSAAAALALDFKRVEVFTELLGFNAFLILKTVHAVAKACPAADILLLVASPACSPYLHQVSSHFPSKFTSKKLQQQIIFCQE